MSPAVQGAAKSNHLRYFAVFSLGTEKIAKKLRGYFFAAPCRTNV